MVFDRNIELKEKQQNLLAELRKIVGRGFDFSKAYLEKCDYECNRIGNGKVRYGRITKKYVYVSCSVMYAANDEETEYGAHIGKYTIYRNYHTDKIALEDLFVCDLEKIVNDIKFALWWEKDVRMKKLAAEMADCDKYVKLLEKFCLK